MARLKPRRPRVICRITHTKEQTKLAPWITNTHQKDDTKILGWMVEALEIDPFDSDQYVHN